MKTCGIRLTGRKLRLRRISLFLIAVGLLVVLHVTMDLTSSTEHFEMYQVSNKNTCPACQPSNIDTKLEKPEDKLIAAGSEKEQQIYKEPVDLVYLWANGSDPRFILDLRRQKATEDEEKYKSPLICNVSKTLNVNIPVIVVYPAMPLTNKISTSDSVKKTFNVSGQDMNYTVIVPKQGKQVSEITSSLIKLDGQTYLCFCGYITNKDNPLAKKTLEHMYLVNTTKYKSFNTISVDTVFQTGVNKGKYMYALMYDNMNLLSKNQEIMAQRDFETESAILVWDPYSINMVGLPTRNRFEDNDQLKYSLRSVEKYASWIQHIYIITNQQAPSWLNVSNPRISVISTEEIFPNKDDLPTFSSPAIESYMHRIPKLSETFLFMCDDFFFGKQVQLSDFYTAKEGLKIFWDGPLGECDKGCTHMDLGNGKCDKKCDTLKCGWDHGECRPIQREQIKLGHPVGLHFGSLYNTMALFNRKFNNAKKYRMPPHVPLLLNKKVAIDLYNSFHEGFAKSSAMHFRSQFNIQYTMAYYEFVSSAQVDITTPEIIDKLCEKKTGSLAYKELENFRSHAWEYLCDACLRVFKQDSPQCQLIIDILKTANITQLKYKHKVSTLVRHFVMIISNLKRAQKDLSKVLQQPRKFNAINDDMDHTKIETIVVKRELKKFYEKLFPKPSQYELVKS